MHTSKYAKFRFPFLNDIKCFLSKALDFLFNIAIFRNQIGYFLSQHKIVLIYYYFL